ncbi:MAG: hypothetical protein WDZ93_03800 [Candidatus Paceibacterota bacterium]
MIFFAVYIEDIVWRERTTYKQTPVLTPLNGGVSVILELNLEEDDMTARCTDKESGTNAFVAAPEEPERAEYCPYCETTPPDGACITEEEAAFCLENPNSNLQVSPD